MTKSGDGPSRPSPVEGIALASERMMRGFAAREDRFSQLLSRSLNQAISTESLGSSSALTDAERAELDELTPGAHESFLKETEEVTAELRTHLSKGNPLYALSMVQNRNLMSRAGEYYEPTHEGHETKVELVAGLLLTQPPPTSSIPVPSRRMQQIFDSIEALTSLSTLVNLTSPSRGDATVDQLRFESALNWTTGRGTSYMQHGRELALELYRPFDAWSLEHFGFTIDDVLAIGHAAAGLLESRHNQARRNLTNSLNALGGPSARPTRKELEGALEPFWRQLGESGSFTIEDLVSTGLDRSRISAVLKELSLSLGSLPTTAYRGLFDPSPLVGHPLVEWNGQFLLVIPGMVLRDSAILLEQRFMKGLSTFSRSRAKTLDHIAVDHVSSVLPDSRGYTNLHYQDTELDGLVLFDNIALVIEGKGSALSTPARRGDVRRLASDIKDSVEEAWNQGARARSYLTADADAVFMDERGKEVLRVAKGSIARVIVIASSLHELGGHAPQLPKLRGLGLFPDGEYPWSVFINDLRVITETAGNCAVFLHYLVWRARLPLGDRITVMDELDLWGAYLLAHRFGAIADDGHELVGNCTTDFDDYYAGCAGDAPKARKPEKFLKGSVKTFVQRMARDRPFGWLEAAGVCLDLSVPEMSFVLAHGAQATRLANQSGRIDVTLCGRVRLIAIPRHQKPKAAMAAATHIHSDATFNIYIRSSSGRRPEIVLAEQAKPVTFDLSDFEKAAFNAVGDA